MVRAAARRHTRHGRHFRCERARRGRNSASVPCFGVLRGRGAWQDHGKPRGRPVPTLLRRRRLLKYAGVHGGIPGFERSDMEKGMCFGALGVAGLMFLLFLVDLLIGKPFGGGDAFLMVDIFGILASIAVGYLGFNALRDLR
jgi:hypothetical protein